MKWLNLRGDLEAKTKLFRFVTLAQLMSFVESGKTYLTRVHQWPDTWEIPLSRLPRKHSNGQIEYARYNAAEDFYGQCWTRLSESDAMWRSYSRDGEGLMLETSADRFELIRGIKAAVMGPVIYYKSLDEVIDFDVRPLPPFLSEAFYKREAFAHEQEVRLLTLNDKRCIQDEVRPSPSFINFNLKPQEFIRGITLDPRAPDWLVLTIERYCHRHGFVFKPTRSALYGNVHESTVAVIQYVPIKPK
jgi:hypothetical protein